jgi:hypothetical protein
MSGLIVLCRNGLDPVIITWPMWFVLCSIFHIIIHVCAVMSMFHISILFHIIIHRSCLLHQTISSSPAAVKNLQRAIYETKSMQSSVMPAY